MSKLATHIWKYSYLLLKDIVFAYFSSNIATRVVLDTLDANITWNIRPCTHLKWIYCICYCKNLYTNYEDLFCELLWEVNWNTMFWLNIHTLLDHLESYCLVLLGEDRECLFKQFISFLDGISDFGEWNS